jgi:hypothetical protein
VSIAVTGQEKESLTVMATIRANGTKEPLSILAKGKTARVETIQIGQIFPHQRDHSESGSTTIETFA